MAGVLCLFFFSGLFSEFAYICDDCDMTQALCPHRNLSSSGDVNAVVFVVGHVHPETG